jgi:hypothetical protein
MNSGGKGKRSGWGERRGISRTAWWEPWETGRETGRARDVLTLDDGCGASGDDCQTRLRTGGDSVEEGAGFIVDQKS